MRNLCRGSVDAVSQFVLLVALLFDSSIIRRITTITDALIVPQMLLTQQQRRSTYNNNEYCFNNNNNCQHRRYIIRRIQPLCSGLEPLGTEGDWTAYLDEDNTGLVYYFNGKTGISVWEKPTPTFPDVVLRGSMKRIAIEKQEAYLKSVVNVNTNSLATDDKKGFFQSIFDAASTDTNKGSGVTSSSSPSPISSTDVTPSSTATAMSTKVEDDVVIDKQQPQDEVKDKGFFGAIFGGGGGGGGGATTAPTTKEVETKSVEKPPVVDVGGFLGNVFKAAVAAPKVDDIAATTTTTSAAAAPSVVSTTPTTTAAPVKIDSAAYVLPHPSKIFWGGEDAVFIKGRTFGVFDGVSGAKKLDGIPLYSKTLANEMKKLLSDDPTSTALSTPDLTRLLTQCANTANEIATGASTAVVASIGADGYLRAVNVGDSTCIVVRNGKIVAKTKEISHYFECPYQLSIDSPDKPKDGTKLNVELMPGDIIFMASDGVFDNLSETDVAELIMKDNRKQLSQIAKRISDLSRKVSQDRNAKTPYAKLAQKYGDPDYKSGLGGKLDDVSCVVVAYG